MNLKDLKKIEKCPRTRSRGCQCESLQRLSESEETVKAICTLEHTDEGVEGVIRFKQKPGQPTIIKGIVKGLTPGKHGFHIHEFGDLSNGCESAGAHYNPDGVEHGGIEQGHVGDLGNITADKSGTARFQLKAHRVELSDIVGRAVVVHADEDDLGKGGNEESLKTGNAGKRVGCGVIRLREVVEEDYQRKLSDKHFDRNKLPQIRRNHLDDSPFEYKEGKISIEKIKPVQSQRVDGLSKKAEDVFLNNEDRPFILDKNNYLVNGHHRYDAAHVLGIKRVPAIRVDASIEELIKHFAHTASNTDVKDTLKAKLQDKIKQRLDAEAGGGAGGGAGAGGSGAGASAGGDGGSTGSSGDGGSADSVDTGSSDSAPTSDAPVRGGFYGIGTYSPSKSKKKKKKKSFAYGQGIYETIEAMQDLNSLLHGIEADLKQREKDLKKLPKKSIYKEEDDDDIVEYFDEIHPVVIKAWKSVYPNVPLKAIDDEDMYMQYTTADEYLPHGGNGKDFYLSLGVQYIGYEEPPMGYVNVGDAYAGNYKGVVAKIIAALFEWLEKRHPNMGVRELGIHMNRNAEAWNVIAKKVGAQLEKRGYYENFADGKVKGKSRPGRVKKAGASCKGSVTDLRAKAKKYSGEKGKMYHWCANMKAGRNK